MKKVFLCALIVFGFMNLSFGQLNSNVISVKTYDSKGLTEKFKLKGEEAISFDIPSFIKENDDLERVVIIGSMKSPFLTKTIKYDSNNDNNIQGEYVCKNIESTLTPFLGVYGATANKELNGVDIRKIIPETSAALAGISADENIIEFDGVLITNFPDLKKAVLSSTIGDRVEVKLQDKTNTYTKYVTLGSRGIEKVTYNLCAEEQIEISEERSLTANNVSVEIYPNPTRSVSYVNYKSESKEDVIFSVIDINGRLLHKEVFTKFDGNLKFDYNIENEISGTYIYRIQQGLETYNHKVHLL